MSNTFIITTMPCTVAVNIKFTYRICSTIVQRNGPCTKYADVTYKRMHKIEFVFTVAEIMLTVVQKRSEKLAITSDKLTRVSNVITSKKPAGKPEMSLRTALKILNEQTRKFGA